MFEQILYEVIASLLPVCIMGMGIVSNWGIFPLSRILKEASKSTLQAILVGHVKWELIRLPELTQCGVE